MENAVPHAPGQHVPSYWGSLDFPKLLRDYPPPPGFFETIYRMPREALRTLQERRFLATVARGWEIPFFQRLWRGAGLQPGDIRTLDDLAKLPTYTVHELRESQQRFPPWGDFMGL